ncbi:MAG TPA: SCP2 sterol-binding domain-containing protein [Candidatus Lokiarchaeia archaeon]|nr:SCP2 sterol-binding domain-containing protein [Candidatus Lokiarchaeia archaeon]
MSEEEKANILATFRSSLDSIFQEKLTLEKWQTKLKNFNVRVNMVALVGPNDKAYLHVIIENGKITVDLGKLDDAEIEISALFDTFFKISSLQVNPLKMLITRKVKVKTSLKNLGKLLTVQNLMIIEKT